MKWITCSFTGAVPTVAGDNYRARRDDSLAVAAPGVLANDSDANGDAMTVRVAGGPGHGTLTLQPDGSFNYAPTAGFTGTDTFTYTASDGKGDSAAATVTIDVGDPVLFSDTFSRATSPSPESSKRAMKLCTASSAASLESWCLRAST